MSAGAQLCKGRYTLVRQLGKTGTANAWRATNNETGASVIVKALHKHVADDADLRERIFAHVAKLATFDHPGFLWVLEPRIEEDEGVYAFVTEFVEGESLRDAVLDGHLSAEDALSIVLQVGDALAFAHEQGVVHRDINPSNILIDATDTPRLIEFGPPRPRTTEAAMEKDRLTDIYGLAMTVVFALYRDDLPMLEVVRDAAGFIGSLPCTPALKDVLCEAANIDANHRYRSARSFCDALEQAAAEGVVDTTPEAPHAPHGVELEAGPNEEYSDPLIRSVEILPAASVKLAAKAGAATRDPLDAVVATARSAPTMSPAKPPVEDSGSLHISVDDPAPARPVSKPVPAAREPSRPTHAATTAAISTNRPVDVSQLHVTPAQPPESERSRGIFIAVGLALVVAVLLFVSFKGSGGDPVEPRQALAAAPSPQHQGQDVAASANQPPKKVHTQQSPEATTGDGDDGSKSTDDGEDETAAGDPSNASGESGETEVATVKPTPEPKPEPIKVEVPTQPDQPKTKNPPKPATKPKKREPAQRTLRETLNLLKTKAKKACSDMTGSTSVSASLTLDGDAGTVKAKATGSHARTNLGRCVTKAIHATSLKPFKTEQTQVTLTIDFG